MKQKKEIFVTDSNGSIPINEAKNLLVRFWQRTSDACPLTCEYAEEEEKQFEKWVKDNYCNKAL